MPTYEFRCPDGRIIERIFKISEVPDAIPTPDGLGVATRIISGGAGLVFKGSGFYITDYGKDGKKDQRSSTTSTGGSSGASESAASTGGSSGSGASSGGASASGESKSTTTPAKSE